MALSKFLYCFYGFSFLYKQTVNVIGDCLKHLVHHKQISKMISCDSNIREHFKNKNWNEIEKRRGYAWNEMNKMILILVAKLIGQIILKNRIDCIYDRFCFMVSLSLSLCAMWLLNDIEIQLLRRLQRVLTK